MSDEQVKITYNLPHQYLEVAKAALTHFHHPTGEVFVETHGIGPVASAVAAVMSISIVYSHLAVESFVNYQLYHVWKHRHDGSPSAERFLATLGYVAPFEALKDHKRVRELGERIKTLCNVLAIAPPHEADPQLWQDFKQLLEVSRHFVIHPYPDPDYFQANMQRILTETKAGKYTDTARDLIGYLYDATHRPRPEWLSKNTLLRFRGIDVLT